MPKTRKEIAKSLDVELEDQLSQYNEDNEDNQNNENNNDSEEYNEEEQELDIEGEYSSNLMTDLISDNINEDMDGEERPSIYSPEWHDYVMSKFTDQEKQFGSPTVDGLRRVTELLLGEIQNCLIQLVQASEQNNNYHCIVSCQLEIGNKVYSDLGDAMKEELTGAKLYCKAAAVAATRAEARCLRKALRLRRTVLAAEELKPETTDQNIGNDDVWEGNRQIHSSQMACIDALLKRYDVDGEKFLRSAGSKPYDNLKNVSYADAQGMIEHLNKYGDVDKNPVPKSLKGYKSGWLN